MWSAWVEDTIEDHSRMLKKELAEDMFNMDKYIKNHEDRAKCEAALVDHMEALLIMQKYLIIDSTRFPQIDWEAIIAYGEAVQDSVTFNAMTQNKLQRAQFELCFISATRSDGVKALQGDLQRGELLDFLMRCAQQWVRQEYGYKEMVHPHLAEFFDAYVAPAAEHSRLEEQRLIIRKSKRLNELLYDNHQGLTEVFEHCKQPTEHSRQPQFTFEAALPFF